MLKGIVIFKGKMGGGKSYGATLAVIRAMKEGHHVYTPARMFPPENLKKFYHVIKPDDIPEIMRTDHIDHGRSPKNEVILYLDEGWIAFNSYIKTNMGLDVQAMIMSGRKMGVSVYITAQRWNLIHINIREVATHIFSCESKGIFHRYIEYDIDEFSDSAQLNPDPLMGPNILNLWLWRIKSKKVYEYYDSYQDIYDMYPRTFIKEGKKFDKE